MSNYRESQCVKMLDAVNASGRAGVTRLEFAKLLGIKKGQHLNGLIAELLKRELAFAKKVKNEHNRELYIYLPITLLDVQS